MSRVTLAINEGTDVRNVGMCHEMPIGIVRIARLLRMRPSRIAAKASGINHFTFFTEMIDKQTGEDLLPRVKALFAQEVLRLRPSLHPPRRTPPSSGRCSPCSPISCTRPSSPTWCASYDLVPCSVDSHIGEYLPFAHEIGGHHPAHVDQFARIDKVSSSG